jgi:hypothetical protein
MCGMSAQPLDVRLSALEASVEHLNGAYEQIDKRLGDLRSDMNAGFARVDQRFETMDRSLKTLIGWLFGQTAVILGAMATVAFALRH